MTFLRIFQDLKLEREPKVYSRRMARLTAGCSGADIANICNEAALLAARTAQKVVRGTDLELAVQRVLGGAEKLSTAIQPEEREMVAYHEAGHAILAWLLPYTDLLLKVVTYFLYSYFCSKARSQRRQRTFKYLQLFLIARMS